MVKAPGRRTGALGSRRGEPVRHAAEREVAAEGAERIRVFLCDDAPDLRALLRAFLEWDGDANQLPTRDKRFIWVDTYARWRITDPLLYFQRLRDERGAQTRLDDILDGETRK